MDKKTVMDNMIFQRLAATLTMICVFCLSICTVWAEQEADPFSDLKTIVTEENRSEYDFTEKALEYLTVIGEQYTDRSILDDGSDNMHEDFGNWVLAELTACGYDPAQIEAQQFAGETMFGDQVQGLNIILTVPGEDPSVQIIVGAHYDGSGLGDNGSGAALLLATAVSLVDVTPQYTIKYAFFDGEEEGKVGSRYYAGQMSEEEIANTLYMINLDALAFGDFCNIYGGVYGEEYDVDFIAFVEGEEVQQPEPEHLEGYKFATDIAGQIGFQVYRTKDLEGYYEANGHGMEPEEAFFTNPWTYAHPAPQNMEFIPPSPAAAGASDQAPFAERGIPYIYFESTNWWAEGTDPYTAYFGYNETYDTSIGVGGQIMNTDYDTLEYLNQYFPGRAEQHYRQYSPLLSALLLVE